jgi:hypothetical protein
MKDHSVKNGEKLVAIEARQRRNGLRRTVAAEDRAGQKNVTSRGRK